MTEHNHTEHIERVEQHVEHGFGPVWDATSRVLVLGSMPSPKSREAGFYYMHRQNRFWPVMTALFADLDNRDDVPGDTPDTRRAFALRHHIALWDVISSCDITGASDATIRHAVANDVTPILHGSHVTHVFTTGAKAGQLYRRLIVPKLVTQQLDIGMTQLPSTSPANAAMRLPELIAVYRDAFRQAGIVVND